MRIGLAHVVDLEVSDDMFSVYRGLPSGAYTLALGRFVAAGGSFVAPFLVILLSAHYGYDARATGMIMAVLFTSMLVGNALGGAILDRFGWKPTVLVCMSIYALLYAVAAYTADSPISIFLLLIAFFFAGVMFVAYTALASQLSTPQNGNVVFSLCYLSYNLGYSVSVALAGIIYYYSIRAMFLLDALLTLLALLVLMKCAVPASSAARSEHESSTIESSKSYALLSKRMLLFSAAFLLIAFVHQMMTFALPLQISLSHAKESATLFGALMSFAGLLIVFGTPLVATWTRQTKIERSLLMGCGLYLLAILEMLFGDGVTHYFIFIVLWIAGEILVTIYGEAYFLGSSPTDQRGRFSSVFHSINMISIIGATLFLGEVVSSQSLDTAWSAGAFLALSALLALTALAVKSQQMQYGETQ